MTTAPLDLNVLRILELVHKSNLLRDVMEPSVRSTINNQELLDKELPTPVEHTMVKEQREDDMYPVPSLLGEHHETKHNASVLGEEEKSMGLPGVR